LPWAPREGAIAKEPVKARPSKEDVVAERACNLDRRALVHVFPALRLAAAIRLAFDLRKLVIAALGIALLQLGWSLLDVLFSGSASVTPRFGSAAGDAPFEADTNLPWQTVALLHQRLTEPARALATPLFALVDHRGGWKQMAHALLGLGWLIAVWGICGGAIARIAIVQVARLRQAGIGEALRFSLKSAGPLIISALCPLFVLALCGAITAAFGVLYWLPGAGPALAGSTLVLPLAVGLVMVLLVAGLMAGWPLMHAAVAAGAADALDALSRTFGYLNQRLGAIVALLAVVWIEGMIGLALVELFLWGLFRLTEWGLGLTAPQGLVPAFFEGTGAPAGTIAMATHAFWKSAVRLLAHGWAYSYFWTGAALLYLWLRHDVDGTPWNEIED
jgi:hypothetical protein